MNKFNKSIVCFFYDMARIYRKGVLFSSTDYADADYKLTEDTYRTGFFQNLPVKTYGLLGKGVLLNKAVNIDILKEKLRLSKDKKSAFCTYLPTFRKSVEDSSISQMQEVDENKYRMDVPIFLECIGNIEKIIAPKKIAEDFSVYATERKG